MTPFKAYAPIGTGSIVGGKSEINSFYFINWKEKNYYIYFLIFFVLYRFPTTKKIELGSVAANEEILFAVIFIS